MHGSWDEGGLKEGATGVTGGDISAGDETSIYIERDTLILLSYKEVVLAAMTVIGYHVHSPSIAINGMLAWIKLCLMGRRLQKCVLLGLDDEREGHPMKK